MAQHGFLMVKHTWNAVSELWHPSMKNMAGPWDRAYGYDMNRYLSLMALWFWVLVGKENSSLISQVGATIRKKMQAISAADIFLASSYVPQRRLRVRSMFCCSRRVPPDPCSGRRPRWTDQIFWRAHFHCVDVLPTNRQCPSQHHHLAFGQPHHRRRVLRRKWTGRSCPEPRSIQPCCNPVVDR